MKHLLLIILLLLPVSVGAIDFKGTSGTAKTETEKLIIEDDTVTVTYEHKTVKVNRQPYELNGTYTVYKGSKGGVFIVIGRTPEGKDVRYYSLPKELKEYIRNK